MSTIQNEPSTTAIAAIRYPDSDGKPMAENTLQFKWIVLIKENLELVFENDPAVFIAGDLLWYPVHGEPGICTAPDVMVAFGRPKGRRGSYKQWEEGGVAPQVVFEVLSPGNRDEELVRKRRFYEDYGVEEYYEYDPDEGTLQGWRRVKRKLRPIAEMMGFVSPRLGIRFEPGEGPDNLTILDREGEPFLTHSELARDARTAKRVAEAARRRERLALRRIKAADERAEAERRNAKAADERAKAADERAKADRQRAEELAAMLRAAGIDPDRR